MVLTIDTAVQQAAEPRLQAVYGPKTRGSRGRMDVTPATSWRWRLRPPSIPTILSRVSRRANGSASRNSQAEKNRATQENYAPGSVFKTVIGLAALEAGLDPDETTGRSQSDATRKGIFTSGSRTPINDLAPPGDYDFRRALEAFQQLLFHHATALNGWNRSHRALGQQLHLGERTGLPTRQEVSGIFPDRHARARGWSDGDTANICIGQGPMR